MIEFLTIRAKAIKESLYIKRYQKFHNKLGLNPPMLVNGREIFNPSFFALYEEFVRREYSHIENLKKCRRIANGEEAGDKNLALIALALDTRKGRRLLAKAMISPIRRELANA